MKKLLTVLVLAVLLPACGGWYNNTKAGLVAANDAVNVYDDVATEVWGEKAQESTPEGTKAFDSLEKSLCFTYLIQDALVIGWGTAVMVNAGIKKETDFTFWVGSALTLLDHFENVFKLWSGNEIPGMIKTAIGALSGIIESFNPGGVMPPGVEPIDGLDCKAVITGHKDGN